MNAQSTAPRMARIVRSVKMSGYLSEISKIIDRHRAEAFVTCPESCWCWDMETVAELCGYSINLPKRWFRCDTCKHCFSTYDEPEDHEGKACPWCKGGSYTESKDYQPFDASKYKDKF